MNCCLSEQQVWWHKPRSWKEGIYRTHSGDSPLAGLGALQSYIYKWLFSSFVWACSWVNTERAGLCRSPGSFSPPFFIMVQKFKRRKWACISNPWEIKCANADWYMISRLQNRSRKAGKITWIVHGGIDLLKSRFNYSKTCDVGCLPRAQQLSEWSRTCRMITKTCLTWLLTE